MKKLLTWAKELYTFSIKCLRNSCKNVGENKENLRRYKIELGSMRWWWCPLAYCVLQCEQVKEALKSHTINSKVLIVFYESRNERKITLLVKSFILGQNVALLDLHFIWEFTQGVRKIEFLNGNVVFNSARFLRIFLWQLGSNK